MICPAYYVRREAVDRPVRGSYEVAVALGRDEHGIIDALTFGGMRSQVPAQRFASLWVPLVGPPLCRRTILLGSDAARIDFAADGMWDPEHPHGSASPLVWWHDVDRTLVVDALGAYGLRLTGEQMTIRLFDDTIAYECHAAGVYREPATVLRHDLCRTNDP